MKKITAILYFILFALAINGQPELLKDISPGLNSSSISHLTALNDKLIFQLEDFEFSNNRSLWRSDGTGAGTVEYFTLPSFFSSVNGFIKLDNKVFFALDDENYGVELWVSDGTESGTTIVKDIAPGTSDGIPEIFPIVIVNATDGKSLIRYYGTYNGELYFSADDEIVGEELWKSDGTESGTVLIKDISIIGPNPNSSPANFLEANGVLFFSVGGELWKTDGSEIGTQEVFSSFGGLGNFVNYQNQLYFTAKTLDWGIELWKSDGTTSGTVLVKDINPTGNASPFDLTVSNDLLFFTATDGTTGIELYRTDGTESGTLMLADINDSESGTYAPLDLIGANGKLFFTGRDNVSGRELWVSDGSQSGTHLVTEINPGGNSGGITILKSVNDKVFFTAWQSSPNTGEELWVSDGTQSGTYLIYDIAEGSQPSFPSQLTKFKEFLFFVAFDINYGFELRKLNCSDITKVKQEFSESNAINLYPNPFIDILSINLLDSFNSGEKIQIEIFNNLGSKVIETQENIVNPLKLNYSFLPSGIFFMKIRYRDEYSSFKIIKF